VQKLILLFKITLVFAVFFDLCFIYLLVITPQLIVKIFLVIMIIVYLFFFILNYRILKDIQHSFRLDQNLKGTLQQVYDNTMSTLAFQRKSSLFIYPIAATAGFCHYHPYSCVLLSGTMDGKSELRKISQPTSRPDSAI
jgi:ABC-type siderophore export system fused ATPase/permease subunit